MIAPNQSAREDAHEQDFCCARRGRHPGRGVAAGVVGGLAAGAIIGSAIANSGPTYVEPAPVYAPPPPVYAEPPAYGDGPVCHTERQQVWDGYAYRMRRVQVCD